MQPILKNKMKHIAQQIVLVLAILALPFYQANARNIEHHFKEKLTQGSMNFTGANKIASSTNDGITYKCAKSAVFGYTGDYLCLQLHNQYDSVTIAPPMNKLSEMMIWRLSAKANDDNIKVAYSRDGSTWTQIPDSKMDYSKAATVTVTLPVSAFYIKIFNSSDKKSVDILQIHYTFLDCNCFTFMPE